MPTAEVIEAGELLLRAGQGPLTIEDILDEVEGARYELIDGSLYVSPNGDVMHQLIATRCATFLATLIPAGLRAFAGINVIDGPKTIIGPDGAVADLEAMTYRGLGVTPQGVLLAVEITSPSTRRRDLTIKRDLYREWGVPYVIVDRRGPLSVQVEGALPDYGRALVDAVPELSAP